MTKTPGAAALGAGAVNTTHGLSRPGMLTQPAQGWHQGHPKPCPQLLVTSDPEHKSSSVRTTTTSSGLSCFHQPDEESLGSDSGCSGSPGSSLGLRKNSDCSSLGLSPSSSFDECEEESSPNHKGNHKTHGRNPQHFHNVSPSTFVVVYWD